MTAIAELEKRAADGDTEAIWELAMAYEVGDTDVINRHMNELYYIPANS